MDVRLGSRACVVLYGRRTGGGKPTDGPFSGRSQSGTGGISIVSGLFVAEGCGKQSETFHFQSGPDKSPVRSNTIPDFRDITVDFVTIYLWALYLSRFSHLAKC